MRLDQFLSQTLYISRSQAKILLKHKEVLVNGTPCCNSAQKIAPHDNVSHQGQMLCLAGEQYFLLYKPKDYVCSHQDDGYPSALRLLPEQNKKLLFAGRLDAQTTGLVLLSSDGQWCHRVTSPNAGKIKRYQVSLEKKLSHNDIEQLQQGIVLRSEERATEPCQIETLDDYHCVINLSEGKYHQVRRMFAAVGNHVAALHRVAIGCLDLNQESLNPGQYRPLTPVEINSFYAH